METSINCIFIGPYGAGHDVLAQYLCIKYDLLYVAPELVTNWVLTEDTRYTQLYKALCTTQQLVPAEMMVLMVVDYIERFRKTKGFIMVNYPTIDIDASMLQRYMQHKFNIQINKCFLFKINQQVYNKRTRGRFIEPKSGRVYYEEFNPPKIPFIDDISNNTLVQSDQEFISMFYIQVAKLQNFYSKRRSLIIIDANNSMNTMLSKLNFELSKILHPTSEMKAFVRMFIKGVVGGIFEVIKETRPTGAVLLTFQHFINYLI